jgi:hypothetical protein
MCCFFISHLKDCHRVVMERRDHRLNHSAFILSVLVYNFVMRKIHLASKYLNTLVFDLSIEIKVEILDIKM